MNDLLPHGSGYTGIKAPAQSDGSYYQAQLLSDGRFRIAKNTGGLFGNWNDFLTNADLRYVVKEIQSFSVTMNNGYATLGTPQEFGVPSGAHVIACTLIGWSSLSSGDIYLTASDTGVYIISGESSITATYIRFRLTYINI